MKNAQKLRVLIIEGVPLTRYALGSLTRIHPRLDVCGAVGDASSARAACLEEKPDLIMLDLELPRGDGLGLLRDLQKLHPPTRVIAVSGMETAALVQRAFRAGARGVLTKKDEGAEVQAGLEQILTGGLFASKRVLALLLEAMAEGEPLFNDARVESLSDRELEVFRRIGQGQGCTTIARDFGVSVKTVETHRARIKKKLGLANGTALHEQAVLFVEAESAR